MPGTPSDNYVSFLEAKLATEVGPHEARELVEEGKAIYLDVRSGESRAQVHIPNSHHIPRRELETRLRDVPKGTVVVTYCSDIGCQASLKGAIILRKNGYDARHMVGGIKFWQEKGYPVTTGTPVAVVGKTKPKA